MPQAPLPAPAARLQVPIFQPLNPGTYMNREPMNVMAYQKLYPNLAEQALKGVQIAGELVKLPREMQATTTEKVMNQVVQARMKAIQARAQEIMKADYTNKGGEAQRSTDLNNLYMFSGAGYSGGRPTYSAEAPFEMAKSTGVLGTGGYVPDTSKPVNTGTLATATNTGAPVPRQTSTYPDELGGQ
jgi:hypothetical protein